MPPPFFIVGSPRSGTTLTAVLLDNHPDVCVGPRAVGARFNRWRQSFRLQYGTDGDARSRSPRQWATEALRADERVAALCARVPDADGLAPRELLARAVDADAAANGATRWGDKCPDQLTRMGELSFLFPEAQFIHVIRDGRAVAVSRRDRQLESAALAIHEWKRDLLLCRLDGQLIGSERYVEVRYEELLAQPDAVCERLCAFLHVPFDAAMLDLGRTADAADPKYYVGGRVRADNLDKWRDKLSDAELRDLETIAGDLLLELGYDLEMLTADGPFEALSPIRALKLRDLYHLRLVLREPKVMRDRRVVSEGRPLPTRVYKAAGALAGEVLAEGLLATLWRRRIIV